MNDFKTFLSFCLNELLTLVPKNLFLVGGFVRERLLLKETFDYDFVISENTLEIAKELARKTRGVFVLLDDERKTARIVWNKDRNGFDLNFDIATIMGNSIEEDLKLRDLTINAIAIELNHGFIAKFLLSDYSLKKSELIDPSGGFEDLFNKIIRTGRKENLEADPLRILRVFRFAAKLGFDIDSKTLNYIQEMPQLILKPAKERVLKEFIEIISNVQSFKYLEKMNEVNLLQYLFQDMGNFYYDSLLKTIKVIKSFELIINNIDNHFSYFHEISEYLNEIIILGHKRYALLKIVLLLAGEGEGLRPSRTRQSHTESLNESMIKVEKFLKIYTFSSVEQQLILKHLKFFEKNNEISNFELTRKNLFHFFKERQNEVTGVLLLKYTNDFSKSEINETILKIFEYYFEDKILSQQPQLLDGNVLIREFRLKPGSIIGKLLNSLQEAQAEKKVTNYQEAIKFITEKLD